MLFNKSNIAKSRLCANQWRDVIANRNAYNNHEAMLHELAVRSGLSVNEGRIPEDVFREFDNVTVERFRSDDGDTFLNDLMPLARSVNIGKLIIDYRKASDSGRVQTSLSGQIGVKMDQVEFSFDGTLVPVSDTGFFRNWREWNAQNSEDFDALIDDQRETVATLRRSLADQFLDGHKDKDGNFIVLNDISWEGMRNDSRVASINIGASGINFDFTDVSLPYEDIEAAFKQVRDVLWIDNNCELEATYYISREIATSFERFSSEFANSENKILQRLAGLMGVAAIKVSSKLIGNELMAFPLDANKVRPIVGMGVNTVAMPRPIYNSNFEFVTWTATGFEVRNDFFGNTCASFAQDLG